MAIIESQSVDMGTGDVAFDKEDARLHFLKINLLLRKTKVARPEIDKNFYEGLGRRHVAVLGEMAVLDLKVQSTREGTAKGWAARYMHSKRIQENQALEELFDLIKEPWPVRVHGRPEKKVESTNTPHSEADKDRISEIDIRAEDLENTLRAGILLRNQRFNEQHPLNPHQRLVLEALSGGMKICDVARAAKIEESEIISLLDTGYEILREPPKSGKERRRL